MKSVATKHVEADGLLALHARPPMLPKQLSLQAMLLIVIVCMGLLSIEPPRASAQESQTPPRGAVVKHLVVRLDLNSISPNSVTVTEGWYRIRILNGISTEALDVDIEEAAGLRTSTAKAAQFLAKTSTTAYLRPGKHFLKVRGKDKWKVEINVDRATEGGSKQ